MLYSTIELQNTKQYKEFIELKDSYYKLSLTKEQNQQSFLKRMFVTNDNNGETTKLHHSFEKYYKNYTKSIEQKVYTIEKIAKDRDLVPIFITLTLPSKYHPFQSIPNKGKRKYVAVNDNFNFEDIETAITTGYQYLNHIYRTFYKRVKNNVDDLLYVKVVENHQTMIPHFHILFYVNKEKSEIIRKIFDNIQIEFNLSQTDFEFVDNELQEVNTKNIKTGVNRASKYIMKYIAKTLNDGVDYHKARTLDGWKRKHRIRTITMSNLPLSMSEYRTIYHNLDEDSKNELLNEAKEKDVNLFYYILTNMFRFKKIYKKDNFQTQQFGNIDKAKVIIFASVTRIKNQSGYCYQNNSFTLFINHTLIYEKQKYTRLIIGDYYNEHKINNSW